MVRPSGSSANSRIDSARDTDRFASSTADWMTARRSVFSASSDDRRVAAGRGRWPTGDGLGVEGDQRGDERSGIADDDRLADQGVRAQAVLERRWGHVLAGGGDDDLLLAAGDPQEAVIVERADVAGQEPSVVVERRGGGGLVVPVPVEHLRALGEDLAVVRDADRGRREGCADRARLPGVGAVDGEGRAGLGQAVALEDLDPDAVEEVGEPFAERAAAAEGEAHASAEDRLQLAVHQPARAQRGRVG